MPARKRPTKKVERSRDADLVGRLDKINARLAIQRIEVWPVQRPSSLYPALFPEDQKVTGVIDLRIGDHSFALDDRVCGNLVDALLCCRELARLRFGRVR